MATTKFVESGTAATQGFEFWLGGTFTGSTGAITSDSQAIFGSVRSIKLATGSGADGSAGCFINTIMADAGRRFSLCIRYTGTPAPATNGAEFISIVNSGLGNLVFMIGLTSTGKLIVLSDNHSNLGTGATTLVTATDYRISCAYTVTSTTVNTITVYLNGVAEITITNATLQNTGGTELDFALRDNGSNAGANLSVWGAHFYVDDGTSGDIGNVRVTAKRPFANGTTNGFTTQIGSGGSGYGTGHSPQVNERPLSVTNGWAVTSAGSAITEEYNIENRATGDNDLTGATIVDYTGWVYTKALIAETGNIIVNGVSSNISITTTNALFTKIAGSSTYPAGTGTDIGEITSTTVTTISLYECGVLVAYIPVVIKPGWKTLLGVGR